MDNPYCSCKLIRGGGAQMMWVTSAVVQEEIMSADI